MPFLVALPATELFVAGVAAGYAWAKSLDL